MDTSSTIRFEKDTAETVDKFFSEKGVYDTLKNVILLMNKIGRQKIFFAIEESGEAIARIY